MARIDDNDGIGLAFLLDSAVAKEVQLDAYINVAWPSNDGDLDWAAQKLFNCSLTRTSPLQFFHLTRLLANPSLYPNLSRSCFFAQRAIFSNVLERSAAIEAASIQLREMDEFCGFS